jgi:hypothetical protein
MFFRTDENVTNAGMLQLCQMLCGMITATFTYSVHYYYYYYYYYSSSISCGISSINNSSSCKPTSYVIIACVLYVYVCWCVRLFYDAVNISDFVASMVGSLVNDELERIWKETVVA